MQNDFEQEINIPEIEEKLEPQAQGGALKRKKKIFSMYGEDWDGEFTRVPEMVDLIPSFKEYYFLVRRKDLNYSAMKIVEEFNEKIKPLRLYPYPKQYQTWRTKWDRQLLLELGMVEQRITASRRINDVVKLNEGLVPTEDDLESGIKTLGGMLVNDAVRQLQDDANLEEIYTSDELVRRKGYALNVFAHVTRNVQGKEALKIKKSAESRETAGFLFNLLNAAKAGRLNTAEMDVMRNAVVVETTAQPVPNE